MLHTYVQHAGIEFQRVGFDAATGATPIDSIDGLDEKTERWSCNPLISLGCIENISALPTVRTRSAHVDNCPVSEAISLGMLRARVLVGPI